MSNNVALGVNRKRHMSSNISLGSDTSTMKTTNQVDRLNVEKHSRNIINQKNVIIERKEIKRFDSDDNDVISTNTVNVIDSPQGTPRHPSNQHNSRTINNSNIVNTNVSHIVNSNVSKSINSNVSQNVNVSQVVNSNVSHVANSNVSGTTKINTQENKGTSNIRQLSTNTVVNDISKNNHTINQDQRTSSSNSQVVKSSSSSNISSHTERHIQTNQVVNHHHRKSMVTASEDVNNQILYRKGLHTSSEALHATSQSALDMRKSICNLHDQGQTHVQNERRSLSSIHRSNQDAKEHNRRSLQHTSSSNQYHVIERPQKIIRRDNLSVGGHFYGQSEARSYGQFTKEKNVQSVERVTRRSNVSNISLGESNVAVVTSYKKEYLPRNIGPCPASLVDTPTGPFKHTRDTKSHKFYSPVTPVISPTK